MWCYIHFPAVLRDALSTSMACCNIYPRSHAICADICLIPKKWNEIVLQWNFSRMTNKARWFLSNLDHTVHCYFFYHKFSHQTKTNTVGHDRDQTWVYTNIEIRLNHVQFYPSAFLYSFAVLTWSFSVVLNNQFDVSFASVWYKSYVAEALTITWPMYPLEHPDDWNNLSKSICEYFPSFIAFLKQN